MALKHEWRKEDKTLYLPKTQPELITIPAQKFFQLSGSGDPNNNPTFAENIETLYALSYAVRMMPKQGYTPEGFEPYTVYPLEGVWGLVDPDAESKNKNNYSYTLMIRQPEFVNEDVARLAIETVRKKSEVIFLLFIVSPPRWIRSGKSIRSRAYFVPWNGHFQFR